MALQLNQIPIEEQFVSIQGEGRNVGVPYVFVRVAGCPLRCNYCDSQRTWKIKNGQIKSLESVIDWALVKATLKNIKWVSVTGGEPLLYPQQLLTMINKWAEHGLSTHIETSGRFYHRAIHEACSIYSPDVKTPCTGESKPIKDSIDWLLAMRDQDQVKCLIRDDIDLDYAWRVNSVLAGRCCMVLQPFNEAIVTDSIKNMPEHMAANRVKEEVPHTVRLQQLSAKYAWMIDRVLNDNRKWENILLTLQNHVVAWGTQPQR